MTLQETKDEIIKIIECSAEHVDSVDIHHLLSLEEGFNPDLYLDAMSELTDKENKITRHNVGVRTYYTVN